MKTEFARQFWTKQKSGNDCFVVICSEYLTTKAGEIFQSLTFDEFFVLVSTLQASEDNFQKKNFGLVWICPSVWWICFSLCKLWPGRIVSSPRFLSGVQVPRQSDFKKPILKSKRKKTWHWKGSLGTLYTWAFYFLTLYDLFISACQPNAFVKNSPFQKPESNQKR